MRPESAFSVIPAGVRARSAAVRHRTGAALATVLVAILLAWLPVLAAGPDLLPDAPETYKVRPGDTLWSISARYLREPWRWREIWHANTGELGDPNLIYPGDVLQLTRVEGRARVSKVGAGGQGGQGGERVVGYQGGMRVVKLAPRVRVASLKAAIPTIPIASIGPFLTQPYVADSDQIRAAPYVVGFPDEHIVAGLGDSVYVRRIDSTANERFQILRPGESLRDPRTNESLGFLANFVATAALERTGDPAKLRVLESEREVSIGDRVIPAAMDEPLTNFFPRPAPPGSRAEILAVLNGVSQVGQWDVVVINAGTREHIETGQIFEVFQGGTKTPDQVRQGLFDWDWRQQNPLSTSFWYGDNEKIRRFRHDEPDPNTPFPPTVDVRPQRSTFIKPFERSGILMIFRTFERVSFGIILDANRAMHIHDRLAPPPA
jgi:hypothetical protein